MPLHWTPQGDGSLVAYDGNIEVRIAVLPLSDDKEYYFVLYLSTDSGVFAMDHGGYPDIASAQHTVEGIIAAMRDEAGTWIGQGDM